MLLLHTNLLVLLYVVLIGVVDSFQPTRRPKSHQTHGGITSATRLSLSSSSPHKKRRRRKDRVDSLVTDIGLTLLANDDKKSKKRKKNDTNRKKDHESCYSIKDVSLKTQLDYARNGHAVLRSFLDPSLLCIVRKAAMKYASQQTLDAWKQKVEVASNDPTLAQSCYSIQDCQDELKRLGMAWYALPFLQFFNTWRNVPSVKQLAIDLGQVAAILMDVASVRLYQDSIFWKRAGDGPTPWHVDARMAPFDTTQMITFWISLQQTPLTSSALVFCTKSHSDFALPFWNDFDGPEYQRLEERYGYSAVDYMPIQLGDVTVHSGWTLHCADANLEQNDRMALAITYVDARAEVRHDAMETTSNSNSGGYGDNEDRWSYMEWVKNVEPRTQFQHELVPIVWPTNDAK